MTGRLIPLFAALLLTGCGWRQQAPSRPAFGGDAQRGALMIGREACGSCHVIPNIADAHGQVGPSLEHFAQRTTVAGLLPNTPEGLTRWLKDPQAVVPGNAMPNAHLTDQEARDVAAYLYTLR